MSSGLVVRGGVRGQGGSFPDPLRGVEEDAEWLGEVGSDGAVLVDVDLGEERLVEAPPEARWCVDVGGLDVEGERESGVEVLLDVNRPGLLGGS